MEEKKLTQNDVATILAEKIGIELKSATISRYNKNGLILMPKRFPNYFNSVSRIYYHPFVPVEIATAYLLFRGDWLRLDSEFRLSRASTQDVYLGRLLFYLYQFNPANNSVFNPDIPLDFTSFLTSIDLFKIDFDGQSNTIPMEFSFIESYVAEYKDKYLKPFKLFNIDEPYLRYIENLYRATFLHLYKIMYGPRVRRLPDSVLKRFSKQNSPF